MVAVEVAMAAVGIIRAKATETYIEEEAVEGEDMEIAMGAPQHISCCSSRRP